MPADLIVYALVAAGLVFWLRNILGTRQGDERESADPFAAAPEDTMSARDSTNSGAEPQQPSPEDNIRDLAAHPSHVLSVEGKAAEAGLLEIAKFDKTFDINFFLEAAQDVFVMVVEGFGKGDRELLEDLLDKPVYSVFEKALDEREKSEQTLENEIQAIRKAEVIGAIVEGKKAKITVRFMADEISVIRDKDGEILSGHPEHTTSMRDVWTFERDIKSRDPRWFVTETRGDFEEDNDIIPNSHD